MLKISLPRYMSLYPVIGLLGACTQVLSINVICNSSIYCSSELLRTIQLSKIFPDSKTFVDLKLRASESKIMSSFSVLMNQTRNKPTREDLKTFLDGFFEFKMELDYWHPPDFNAHPPFVDKIKDRKLRKFAMDIINIWPKLGRKVSPDVVKNPDRYSFISVPKGIIVPGGRFKELYYWDSYWIIRGLLICNMKNTARGMIENFFLLVLRYGYIPNGSRVYYLGRSQPPLLAWMVSDYYAATGDIVWLKKKIAVVELELEYWLENKQIVVEINENKYKLLRYISNPKVKGPRPESYYEDYMTSRTIPRQKRENFYRQIKSAAESGWDFSSRWFVTAGKVPHFNLTDTKTTQILPVDLNSIFAGALQKMGDLFMQLEDKENAKKYLSLAKDWRSAIENVMWDPDHGVWFDYDIEVNSRRNNFYLSCAAPLWAGAVQPWQAKERAKSFVKYLQSTGALKFPGGVPTSLRHTGEQWDYPNAWPPLQAMLIGALEHSPLPEAHRLAKELIETWVRANYIGYSKHQQMYEKYSCSIPGEHGGGGEYEVQSGFGWTNGYILELLERYGNVLEIK